MAKKNLKETEIVSQENVSDVYTYLRLLLGKVV